MSSAPRVLLPTGFGLNCEAETSHAFERLGATCDQVHFTDLFGAHRSGGRAERSLSDYQVLAIIGGFAYGDHIAGGLVLAARIKRHMRDDIAKFLERGGLVIGICNGFQTLIRLGLLPGPLSGAHDFVQSADLAPNDRLGYRDAWVHLRVDENSRCLWTKGIDRFELPSRHGEGKFLVEPQSLLDELEAQNQVAVRYVDDAGNATEDWPWNPNGSYRGIAGVCDNTGRIFGLMPHPDAFLHPWHHPRWRRSESAERDIEPAGLRIFEAGLRAAKDAL